MADEIRRSGRATKGQHTKGREESTPAPKKGKATAKGKKAASQPEPEEEDEEDAIIRCICGEYNEDEEGRTMICCDKCEAWQHNDCMGLPDDYSPPKYFCEQCKPSDHKELLAAVKRGEKPWEEAARLREEAEAEKAKKKGKKGSRRSGVRASEDQRTPTLEPEENAAASRKRKLEESPAPAQSSRSKKARASLHEDVEAPTDAGVTQDGAQDGVQQDPVLAGVAKDAKDISDPTRSKIATGVIKSFVEQANSLASKNTLALPKGETAKQLGTQIALQVEHWVYQVRSGGTGEPSDAYKDHMRAILNNIKSNADLAARLMNRELPASELAAMDPRDMATEEQKQRDADEKIRMEKQHVLTEEETGPRIRKTHKGEEYVDEPQSIAEPAPSNEPVQKPSMADQDAEMKEPPSDAAGDKPQPLRKPSASGKGKPFAESRRKSSANFDIDKVWSGVSGSPTDGEAPKVSETGQSHSPPVAQATAGADADVDRLLKDEDNESEPYSPKEFVEEGVIWRGRINGSSLGTFNAVAKFAAGCQPDVENLRMRWDDVLPPEIKLQGRIQPGKADEYLCGLEYSNSSELIIVSLLEPKDAEDQREFIKFFNYLKQKDRYGVGSQHQNPAIKDIYMLPMETGQPLPTVMKALEHTFPDPVEERMLLVPIVIRWTELPHNAERVRQHQLQQAAQSPSVGPPVAQTPITPREPQGMPSEAIPYGQPYQGQPMNGGVHTPQHAATQALASSRTFTPHQQGQQAVAHAPVQAPVPQNIPPAAINAQRILGPEMAVLPAVIDLIAQAPNAGENEFNIIKECIVENPEAGRSLVVLTQSLQQKYQSQRSAKEQAAQAPVAAQT